MKIDFTPEEISHIQNALLEQYRDEWCGYCESICVKLGIELRPEDLPPKPKTVAAKPLIMRLKHIPKPEKRKK